MLNGSGIDLDTSRKGLGARALTRIEGKPLTEDSLVL